jgi:general secretion pathway protein G
VKHRSLRRTAARGMTLIEIMVVLVIIGLIMSVVAVNVIARQKEAEIKKAKADVQNIANQGIDAFRSMKGRYPTTEEGLKVLIQDGFLRPNNDKGQLVDPWGKEYIYLYPGQAHPDSFDVKSFGPDGQPGGDGENADIVNY